MNIMKTLLIFVLFTVISGCNAFSDSDSQVNYDNPNLTGGLLVFPDRLIFSDNTTKQFVFKYDNRLVIPVGIDTDNIAEIYKVTYDVNACMAANALDQMCTVTVQYKDPAYVCSDTQLKTMLLKFRYVIDFGAGFVKDHVLSIQCQKN